MTSYPAQDEISFVTAKEEKAMGPAASARRSTERCVTSLHSLQSLGRLSSGLFTFAGAQRHTEIKILLISLLTPKT